ncbi:hypothetical protein [Muricoccus aerilatus]|uniref:hypothetical protein n=1 Tax=Muricoccus aerilatus TaxID=452982 RepID=UPI0005C1EAB0|nr:hypothetical protein [Roseomonas aerilata]
MSWQDPGSDQAHSWAGVTRFLEGRIPPGGKVVAPDALAAVLGPLSPPDPADLPDWAVVSLAEADALPPALLRRLLAETTPVFADDAHVVFARRPTFGLPNLRGAAAVRSLAARPADKLPAPKGVGLPTATPPGAGRPAFPPALGLPPAAPGHPPGLPLGRPPLPASLPPRPVPFAPSAPAEERFAPEPPPFPAPGVEERFETIPPPFDPPPFPAPSAEERFVPVPPPFPAPTTEERSQPEPPPFELPPLPSPVAEEHPASVPVPLDAPHLAAPPAAVEAAALSAPPPVLPTAAAPAEADRSAPHPLALEPAALPHPVTAAKKPPAIEPPPAPTGAEPAAPAVEPVPAPNDPPPAPTPPAGPPARIPAAPASPPQPALNAPPSKGGPGWGGLPLRVGALLGPLHGRRVGAAGAHANGTAMALAAASLPPAAMLFSAAGDLPEAALDAALLLAEDAPGAEAARIARLLRPGGLALLVAENAGSLGRRLAAALGRPVPPGGSTAEALRGAAHAAGLQPLRLEGHLLDAWRATADAPPYGLGPMDAAAALLEEAGQDAGPRHAAWLLLLARKP